PPAPNSAVPVRLPAASTAVTVTAGAYHSCAALSDGTMRCWGLNTSGQLGGGTTTSGATFSIGGTPPPRVKNLSTTATAAAAGIGAGLLGLAQLGGFHTCALLSNGTV